MNTRTRRENTQEELKENKRDNITDINNINGTNTINDIYTINDINSINSIKTDNKINNVNNINNAAFFRTNRKRSPSPPGPIKALMKSADSRIDQRFSGVRNPTILEPSMKEYIDQIIDDNKTSTQAHTHIKKMAKSDNMNCLIF